MKVVFVLALFACVLTLSEALAAAQPLRYTCDIQGMYRLVRTMYSASLGLKDELFSDVMGVYRGLLKCVEELEFTGCVEEAVSSGVQEVREDVLDYAAEMRQYLDTFYGDVVDCTLV